MCVCVCVCVFVYYSVSIVRLLPKSMNLLFLKMAKSFSSGTLELQNFETIIKIFKDCLQNFGHVCFHFKGFKSASFRGNFGGNF